jgi:hypothetical protein
LSALLWKFLNDTSPGREEYLSLLFFSAHRVLRSGISTEDWKENSILLKAAFVCFDCIPVPQTGGCFSHLIKSYSAASHFHGFPTLVYDVPSFNAFNDSFLKTSHSTSVFNDFSNLAIDVTNYIND